MVSPIWKIVGWPAKPQTQVFSFDCTGCGRRVAQVSLETTGPLLNVYAQAIMLLYCGDCVAAWRADAKATA